MRPSASRRARDPRRHPAPAGRRGPGPAPTDVPSLIIIVIIMMLASAQVVEGRQTTDALQLLAGASAIGLEVTRRVKAGR